MGNLRGRHIFLLWMSSLGIAALLSVTVVFPYVTYAQAAGDAEEGGEEAPVMLAPQGTASCFDYYTFGSVQAKLSTSVTSVVSGTSAMFSGTLENANPYPVVDGALYVKVFKTRNSTDGNGPDVVDQFFVQDDIIIPAGGSVPISFAWRVPSHAVSGDYQLATFFVTSRKFNLLGLSFTDDVVGNTVPFSVVGEQQEEVRFDKASVTVGGEAHTFAASPVRASTTDPVTVTARIENTAAEAVQANVSWTVYQWDALLRENAVQEDQQQVEVPAEGSVPVSITVTDARYPVYLVVGELMWNDVKSIIGVRFGRDGVERTRINFPGVTSFPLRAGEVTTIFSCLHNSGISDVVPGGRLELALSDFEGNEIHSYTYTGDVTGAMMGVAEEFVPRKSYGAFVLDARLFQGDQFIDEAHLVFDCVTLDPGACVVEEEEFITWLTGQFADPIYLAGGAAGLVLLILLPWMAVRLARPRKPLPPPPTAPARMVIPPQRMVSSMPPPSSVATPPVSPIAPVTPPVPPIPSVPPAPQAPTSQPPQSPLPPEAPLPPIPPR